MQLFNRGTRTQLIRWGVTTFSAALVAAGVLAVVNETTPARAVEIRPAVLNNQQQVQFRTVAAAKTGTFSGVVTLDGAAPDLKPVVGKGEKVKDSEVCSVDAIPDESLVVNDGKIANVFIYLAKAPSGYKAKTPKEAVVFDQKGCRFLPHALMVQTKQEVLVKSDDPIAHNTHTNPLRNTAFNQVIKAGDRTGVPLVYTRPERIPVKVVCDLHKWMNAYHLVLDHPFMAVTDENGKFEITGLPAGKHSFYIWQEKTGYLDRKFTVEIKAGKATEANLKFAPSKFASFHGPQPTVVAIDTTR